MKFQFLIIFILNCEIACSQFNFTKLIDLEFGQFNFQLDFELKDTLLLISSKHLCAIDSFNTDFVTCTGLSKFDQSGNLVQKVLLDSFYPEGFNRMLVVDTSILLTGHNHEIFEGRPTMLKYFNLDLMHDSSKLITSSFNSIVNNEGIISYNNSFYLYGTKLLIEQSKEYSNIVKIDSKGEVAWNKNYSRGSDRNEIYDLQNTVDGNLIFFQYYNDGAGSQGSTGFQIVKIDTNGIALDSFEFKDISIENPRLLASSNGSIYFTSQDPPFPHTFPSNGRINKIDKDLDSIEWSFLLPTNPFVDGHRYKVYDYLETKEGDIVLCGTVWEEGPDGPSGTPENHTWNGFVSKIDSLGQFKWLRIYRHPNIHPLLQFADYGQYRPSYLNKIYELPNNNLIVAGSAYFDSYQEFALPSNEVKSSIWLMNVDSVGCLENEECTLTILLDGANNQLPIFQIGTSWTYEVEEYPLPIHVTYQKFTISDTSSIGGNSVFVIENDFDNEIEFMYENENKVYFWDNKVDSFRLHYNFNDILQYSSPWSGSCGSQNNGVAIISIDSISDFVQNFDTLKIQNISIGNNGTVDDAIIAHVYKNIGLNEFGIKLPLGQGFCDNGRAVTKLRCFESGNISHQFVNYPCDSSWFTTSLPPNNPDKYILYPNPSSGAVNINTDFIGFSYKLISLSGHLIGEGIIQSNEIYIPYSGTYVLQLFNSEKTYNSLIVIDN